MPTHRQAAGCGWRTAVHWRWHTCRVYATSCLLLLHAAPVSGLLVINAVKWPADAAFTGRHRFLLTAAPSGRTKFEHSEEFTGFLTPILARLGMFKAIAGMYERMNEALKIRVEQLAELAQ